MKNSDFYDIFDKELEKIIEFNDYEEALKRHKKMEQKKPYAFLLWFLQFYGNKVNFSKYVTEGVGDFSCDLILDAEDKEGHTIFYVVQSKWNNKRNVERPTKNDDIKKAISDFDTLLKADIVSDNERLNTKLTELNEHLKRNGEVKFIFLSLAKYEGGADDNINTFTAKNPRTFFEVIDIDRLKHDFIDRHYKQINPINPLEKYFNPEEAKIELNIVPHNGKFLRIDKPFDAVTLLLKPKSIYELFDKYGFALFFKNVRNPLIQSAFNEEIEQTILENPAYFWYYNNGITAITKILTPIADRAEKITLTGLQIINGAQTVYAIYRAYKNASSIQREKMNNDAFINLRLLESGGKDFDLNVTRYTNSQNPVNDRDFCANDAIQIRLQNESFNTNVWYEKRKDEFRNLPKGIRGVPNISFADAYLTYHLQKPHKVFKNFVIKKQWNFISKDDDNNGLYELVFNTNTTFNDMLCSFYLYETFYETSGLALDVSYQSGNLHILGLFQVVFYNYLVSKLEDTSVNVNNYILNIYRQNDIEIILKTYQFINDYLLLFFKITLHNKTPNPDLSHFINDEDTFNKILKQLAEYKFSHTEIDNIQLKK